MPVICIVLHFICMVLISYPQILTFTHHFAPGFQGTQHLSLCSPAPPLLQLNTSGKNTWLAQVQQEGFVPSLPPSRCQGSCPWKYQLGI